jgi:hypothetical protein
MILQNEAHLIEYLYYRGLKLHDIFENNTYTIQHTHCPNCHSGHQTIILGLCYLIHSCRETKLFFSTIVIDISIELYYSLLELFEYLIHGLAISMNRVIHQYNHTNYPLIHFHRLH